MHGDFVRSRPSPERQTRHHERASELRTKGERVAPPASLIVTQTRVTVRRVLDACGARNSGSAVARAW